ncbi:carboxymuconolactone decarboxylase family protein [Actinoplanes sp. HUAS TT8]|uniref:carboxymuconolactone decarboxylase family protein n=1 Tax=Actinoplanes sp. HUAS TT8 TaxID=3447453 RepID=UPI003F526E9E
MSSRLTNAAGPQEDVVKAVNLLYKSAHSAGVPDAVLELVHLRTSQINGCGPCVDAGARSLRKAGESDDRLFAVPVWRETPYFTEPERAALALSEYATRLADNPDPVPDAIWDEAAKHFTEDQLAAIVLWIATSNFFNRINVTTKQQAPMNWG